MNVAPYRRMTVLRSPRGTLTTSVRVGRRSTTRPETLWRALGSAPGTRRTVFSAFNRPNAIESNGAGRALRSFPQSSARKSSRPAVDFTLSTNRRTRVSSPTTLGIGPEKAPTASSSPTSGVDPKRIDSMRSPNGPSASSTSSANCAFGS